MQRIMGIGQGLYIRERMEAIRRDSCIFASLHRNSLFAVFLLSSLCPSVIRLFAPREDLGSGRSTLTVWDRERTLFVKKYRCYFGSRIIYKTNTLHKIFNNYPIQKYERFSVHDGIAEGEIRVFICDSGGSC